MFTGQESCQVNFIDKSPKTYHKGLCLARIQQLCDPIPIHPHHKTKQRQIQRPFYNRGVTRFTDVARWIRRGNREWGNLMMSMCGFFLNVSKDLLSDRWGKQKLILWISSLLLLNGQLPVSGTLLILVTLRRYFTPHASRLQWDDRRTQHNQWCLAQRHTNTGHHSILAALITHQKRSKLQSAARINNNNNQKH